MSGTGLMHRRALGGPLPRGETIDFPSTVRLPLKGAEPLCSQGCNGDKSGNPSRAQSCLILPSVKLVDEPAGQMHCPRSWLGPCRVTLEAP